MPSVSLMLTNAAYCDNNVTTPGVTFSMAGINSWIAYSFWAYNDVTINRVSFWNTAITNGTRYNIRVGIGTMDRTTGLPASVGGLGQSLIFSSSNDFTNITAGEVIHAIPDFQMSAKTKYWVGQHIVSQNLATYTHTMGLLGLANPTDRASTNMYFTRTTGAVSQNQNDGNRFIPANWGYDSGNGVTIWYNPFPGSVVSSIQFPVTLTNMMGFTFNHTTDFESIYVDSVRIIARLMESIYPTGTGTTVHSILYDSDGTTALTGFSTPFYTANTVQNGYIVLPVQAWLQRNKLYHLAFAFQNAAAGGTVIYNNLPYSWQAATGYTSIFFTKAGGSAAPVYFNDRIVPFGFYITKTRGHLQNSAGDNVF